MTCVCASVCTVVCVLFDDLSLIEHRHDFLIRSRNVMETKNHTHKDSHANTHTLLHHTQHTHIEVMAWEWKVPCVRV